METKIYHNKIPIIKKCSFINNFLSQMFGLMFHKSIPEDYALIFIFKTIGTVRIHMLFVFFPIDVIFLNHNKKIIGTTTLNP